MADMPDISAYGIQAPGPNPSMMQVGITAPNAPIPTYQVPQFPQVSDYNVPQQQVPVQTPIQQPSRGLPTLADFISNAEIKSGKPIDQKTFDDMASWYKTNVLTQALWGQKGATKDKVAAEIAAYDDAVNREAHKRFANQTAPVDATKLGSAGAFTTAAKGGLERGAAGLSMLLGGVANLGGLAPNKLGDYLLSQANPEQQDLSKTDLVNLSAQRDKLLAFYANNPKAQADIHAQLDPKIAALQQGAGSQNLVESGNENIANAYDSGHNIAATLGVAAGQLLPFILTRGGGAAALAGTAGATAASNVATNAASQLGRGDSLTQVETQALPDAALETLMAYLPTKFAGGAISRVLKGAGTAGGVATAQQIIDKAINSKNEISPESIGVAAALGGGLALLHGQDVQNILSKLGKKKPTLKTPPSGSAAPKSESAPLSAAAGEVESSMTPQQAYKDLMNNNITTEGLPDQEFSRINNNIGQKAEMMAKKFKPSKSFDSPEDLIGETIKYAKALTKDKFYQMTPEQREELVGNLATWFGKRAKIDNNDISNAILGMRTVPAAENATATPPEPTAQTTEQEAQTPTQQPQQTATSTAPIPETNTYTPVTKYNPIWQAASDSNTPISQLPQEMQVLATQVRTGRISDRQTFDKVLQTAETKAGNKLKAQPKQQADTTSLHPPENQTAQAQVADTRKVSDVLASRSTKTSEINLRKQLRAMLKASGAKDTDLEKLKNLSVKSLQEKAKATKNKQILAKTNIEPVENPDEVAPKPASKNKLKKQPKTQNNEATDAASLYAAKNNIPYAFMSSISKAYDLTPEEVGAVWNRYKDAGLIKLDKKNPQNYALKNDNLTKEDMVRSTLSDARAAGEVEGSPPPKSQAPAKGSAGANKQTPLEKLLQERLGDRLPKERLDELHNAIETAETGDKNDLTDLVQGLKDSGDLSKNEVKWLKDLPNRGVAHDLVNESKAQEIAASKSKEIDKNAKPPKVPKRVRIRAVPLGAGLSRDGSTLYVDSHIPESINVPRSDGTVAHVVLYDPNDPTVGGLVVHEGNEFPQMHERGKSYGKAHDENANHAEDAYYKAKYGVSRAAVDKALKPYLDAAEESSANNSDIPHDLDTKPYEDSGKTHLLNNNIIENNASGESSASLEAQRRVADERAAGRTRAVIRRNGTVEPLVGVDAVDTHARAGEVYVQRGIGRRPDEWTILSHGDDMSRDAAMGKVNKAKQALDDTYEEMQTGRSQENEKVPEHTISPEEFETLYSDRTKGQENNLPQRSERIAPLNVKREVDNIVQNIREGSNVQETGVQLKDLSDRIAQRNLERNLKSMRGMRRGPEWVKTRLQRLIADSDPNSDHYAAAKMAQWLLDQNPNIADSMAIAIRKMESGEAGRFNPVSRILQLNSNSLNKATGLHELLHASERLLPPDVQDKLHGEYIGRIQNKLKKAENAWQRNYLRTAIRNFVSPNKSDQLAMLKMLREHRAEIPANEYYKYFDPSEYWAEEGSEILSRRYGADSWIGKAKQWLSEFAQHVKKVFGLDNNSEVIKGLNKMLKATEGESGMLNKGDQEARAIDKKDSKDYDDEQVGDDPTDEELGYATDKEADIDPNMEKEVVYNKKAKDLGDYTETDKLIEQLANADHGLEKTIQFGHREGIPINEDNNVFDAAYQKRGVTANTRETDRYEVVNPADDWVHENYSKFADSTSQAYDRINDFYGTKNLLERAETAWWLESPLGDGAEIDRATILEKVVDGDIAPDKARAQLQKLAKDHSILDWEEYAESKGTDIEALQNKLKELKAQGVDENTLAEHNELTQNIRDRLQDNLLKSGDTTEADPYVKLYNWKWYVPLKGSPFASNAKVDGNFDLIPEKNIALARLNKQMAVMKGRNSLTDRPYFRLLVDLARSADRVGHKIVMDRLYNLLTTEDGSGQLALKKYGAKIDVWHGFQKKGYTDAKGKHVDRLKAPANGVIINDGDTHYIVTLPHNSPLLRGLIQMDNIKAPKNPYVRKIGKFTNTLARLYTTLDPRWVVSVGFARDITYVPFSIAVTRFSNPLQAIPFITRYIPEIMGAYKALPTILPQIAGNEAALRTMAEANPEGWAAMTMRYKAAGGSNYFTKGFDIGGVERELLSRYQDTNGVIDLTKYGAKKVMDYTGNFANSLEQLTRVAMFKQLLKEGMTDTEAAVQVRKIMDYEQSGTHGRLINSWLAFFRVGATGTDVIRRAFTKPGGGLDYAKFAKWQAFMGALGYLSYMGAMSLLGKDDDGKYKIQKINPDQLTSKAFFPVGDKIGSINLGLGIPQVLLAPGILAAALEQGHIDERTALKSYLDMLERNGPTSPGGALGNNPTDYLASALFGFVPTAVRPIIDTSRNTSSFSSPIHTTDADRNKFNSDQGYPNTAKQYKDIATWIREHSGNTIDIFPEDIKYWIESYGGAPATDFTKWAFENGNVAAGGQAPLGRLAGSFYVDTSHYMSRDLFDTLDTLTDSSKRYNHLVSTTIHQEGVSRDQAKAKVQEIVDRDPAFAKRLEAYKELLKAHKDYNKQVNALRDNKLLSDTRKQLVRKQADSQLRKAIEKAQAVIDSTEK